ncbi:hypothetical protein OAO01_01445 [Oligoflexia bacterium]|nr:hypothetical protein [Oligoflexia bacterium]
MVALAAACSEQLSDDGGGISALESPKETSTGTDGLPPAEVDGARANLREFSIKGPAALPQQSVKIKIGDPPLDPSPAEQAVAKLSATPEFKALVPEHGSRWLLVDWEGQGTGWLVRLQRVDIEDTSQGPVHATKEPNTQGVEILTLMHTPYRCGDWCARFVIAEDQARPGSDPTLRSSELWSVHYNKQGLPIAVMPDAGGEDSFMLRASCEALSEHLTTGGKTTGAEKASDASFLAQKIEPLTRGEYPPELPEIDPPPTPTLIEAEAQASQLVRSTAFQKLIPKAGASRWLAVESEGERSGWLVRLRVANGTEGAPKLEVDGLQLRPNSLGQVYFGLTFNLETSALTNRFARDVQWDARGRPILHFPPDLFDGSSGLLDITRQACGSLNNLLTSEEPHSDKRDDANQLMDGLEPLLWEARYRQ